MAVNYDDIMSAIVTPEYPTDPLELLGERSFNEPFDVSPDKIGSPVQEFFRDTTIFITGATGFLGRVLLEKLLRSCPHIKRVYLLIREKRGKTSQERLENIFSDRLYNRLKYEVPNFIKKVFLIIGNIEKPGFGLSNEDREMIIKETNIIYHCAANVRFDESFTSAIKNKVYSTRYTIHLARECKALKAIMYVSTAYSFCSFPVIEEDIPAMPVHYNDILQMIEKEDEKELDAKKSQLLMNWPNSYTFSKALAECMIKEEVHDLPIAIFRPSVVLFTYREPVKGWINNGNGPIAFILGANAGIIHVLPGAEDDKFLNIIPVDLTANALICATKETAEEFSSGACKKNDLEIPIYNYVNTEGNYPTWGEINRYNESSIEKWPHSNATWIYNLMMIRNGMLFSIVSYVTQYLRGYIIDGILLIKGQKPIMTKLYQRYHEALSKVIYFAYNKWTFKNTRIQNLWNRLEPRDREIFFFNMADVSLEPYFKTAVLGMRVYFLKDDIHTLPAARERYKRLYLAHHVLKYSLYIFLVFLIWKVLNAVRF